MAEDVKADDATKTTGATQTDDKSASQASDSKAEAKAASSDPDSRRIKLVRVDHPDGPALDIPYEDGSGHQRHWYPDAALNEFEEPALIAAAAVASGFFAEADDTKTKLKKKGA